MANIKNLKVNLENKILQSNNVIIVPHKDVDFDAIGSSIGLSLIANEYERKTQIVVNDPIYKIDSGVQTIINDASSDFSIVNKEKCLRNLTGDDLFILTDVNKSYMVSLSEAMQDKDKVIIIDHHEKDKNTIPASYEYIDCNVSSACEIVSSLLNLFKIKYSSKVANYLLAGIYLDTNKLTKNVTANTMTIAGRLMSNGANMNYVTDLFSEDYLKDKIVLNLVEKAMFLTYSIATIVGDEEVIYTKEQLAKAADYMLKYRVDASFAMGNVGDNTVSISARSKEKVDVGQIMKELGGGGNQYSGATKLKNCTLDEASKKLVKLIKAPCYIK